MMSPQVGSVFKRLAGLLVACLILQAPAFGAEPLPAPQGEPVLTVTGRVGVENVPGGAAFDWELLESLPKTTLRSHTDWTEGEQVFEGVLLKDLVERIGGSGSEIVAHALNDYFAVIPWSDLNEYSVLLAYRRNGERMSLRDKGPIWIIYPSDRSYPEQAGPHNMKMVWQLNRLDLR